MQFYLHNIFAKKCNNRKNTSSRYEEYINTVNSLKHGRRKMYQIHYCKLAWAPSIGNTCARQKQGPILRADICW